MVCCIQQRHRVGYIGFSERSALTPGTFVLKLLFSSFTFLSFTLPALQRARKAMTQPARVTAFSFCPGKVCTFAKACRTLRWARGREGCFSDLQALQPLRRQLPAGGAGAPSQLRFAQQLSQRESQETFPLRPWLPLRERRPRAGGGGTKCQKGNSWHRKAMTERVCSPAGANAPAGSRRQHMPLTFTTLPVKKQIRNDRSHS